MTGLQLFIAIAGIGVTVLVGVGMIFLTPRYTVAVEGEGAEARDADGRSAPESNRSREAVGR